MGGENWRYIPTVCKGHREMEPGEEQSSRPLLARKWAGGVNGRQRRRGLVRKKKKVAVSPKPRQNVKRHRRSQPVSTVYECARPEKRRVGPGGEAWELAGGGDQGGPSIGKDGTPDGRVSARA